MDMPEITSSRNYYPGDVIYSEESFAQVLPRKMKDVMCEWCGKGSLFLKACKQCLAVKYCGKTCQKNDWSTHRLECTKMKNLPDGEHTDTVRLLGKIVLKIKGKDWKVVKKRIMGTDLSFDDINSHYKAMTENPRLNLLYKELKELTSNYIGKENMPGDVDFIKIVGKVRHNTFTPLSHCFYIGLSSLNMECIPNTNVGVCGRNAKIWAIKKINKGIDKITIPNQKILSLKRDFLFQDRTPCKCSDCSLPYGESILTKILDEKRAYSIICDSEVLLNLVSLSEEDVIDNMGKIIDDLLQRQEGVLGNTNLLRLKMLALKCFRIGGHPLVILRPLLNLEMYMRSVFGDFYSEMLPIYQALTVAHFHLGNPTVAFHYAEKAMVIERFKLE